MALIPNVRTPTVADKKSNVALRAVDFRIQFTFSQERKFFLQIEQIFRKNYTFFSAYCCNKILPTII